MVKQWQCHIIQSRVDFRWDQKLLIEIQIYLINQTQNLDNLQWTTHVHISRLQLSKVCYIIKLVQGIIGLGMIRSFHHSKFESLVRYCIIVWGADNESVPIFKLQKRVIRSVCGAGTGTSCRQLLKDRKIH